METNSELNICKNCGNHFQGNFCNVCGQKVITSRFTLKMILHDALSIFNLERGFFYTIYELFKNPGKVIKEYLDGRTKVYFNPLKLLIILVGISVLIMIITNSYDDSMKYTSEITQNYVDNPDIYTSPMVTKMQMFFKNYLNIIMILFTPFYAIGFRIMFSKSSYYYSEHLIINSYAFGMGTLLEIIISGILFFTPHSMNFEFIIANLIMWFTFTYFYYKITNSNLIFTFIQSVFAILIGMVLFFMFFTTLMMSTIFIIKKMSFFSF